MRSPFRLNLLAILLTACSTAIDPAPSSQKDRDLIEGYWRFSDRLTTISIERCASGIAKLCGLLIAFDGERTARNYETSDLSRWGERRCRSEVIVVDPDPERDGLYVGRIQDPSSGQTYAVELTLRSKSVLEAHTFLSVTLDETVDMALHAALGRAPTLIDTGSYIARTLAGKELHSEVERWRRISLPHQRCDRPIIKSNKGGSK